MPIRKIPLNRISVTGYFYSNKNGRTIAFESLVERDYYLLLEFEASVEKYEEQPLSITKQVNGRETTYFPDCLVTFKPEFNKAPQLTEIKTSKELKNKDKAEKLKNKFTAMREYAKENGMDFKVVLDTDIRGQYLENLNFLYRYSDTPKSIASYKGNIMETLNNRKSMTVSEILDSVAKDKSERARIIPIIWHLVYVTEVKTDLNKPLTNSSILEVNNEGSLGQEK